MKVVFITPVVPYKENIGGPSGHPYHLMIERPDGIDITIYSYNFNHLPEETIHQVEKELCVNIKILKQPTWWLLILRLHLTFIRLLLKYPINSYYRLSRDTRDEIKQMYPDLIWGYCQEFNGILKQFKEYKRLHTVPDCYSLHFYRRLGRRQTLSNTTEYWRIVTNYIKHYRMERDFDNSSNIVYHLVGEEDKNFLLEINPKLNAYFVRHPLYVMPQKRKVENRTDGAASVEPCLHGLCRVVAEEDQRSKWKVSFHSPKIKLLIAGQYNLYMKQESDLLIEQLAFNENDNENKSLTPNPSPKERRIKNFSSLENSCERFLQENYVITFLGKGWERHVEPLRGAGYEVEHIRFAPDYIEEICKHDIQITPISIGTGTKGKVLDALANGLLMIGTPYAMENIAVESGESCIEYRDAKEVIDVLKDIPTNQHKYEMMAEKGRQCVLEYHDRAKIAKELFNLSMQV